MSKPLLGLMLGGVLGILDGVSALLFHPEDPNVEAGIVLIVIMGTFKGLITGVAIGVLARRFQSLPVGIVLGLALGLTLAAPVAYYQGEYYLEIVLPGGVLGMIVGIATQLHHAPDRGGTPA